jgi:hypothetical protein
MTWTSPYEKSDPETGLGELVQFAEALPRPDRNETVIDLG